MTEEVKTIPQAHADFDRAIDKIRDEMAKDGGRYAQVVGDYLTGYLRGHPAAAGAILAKDKTIAGSLAAMRNEAEKVKDGGMAVLDDETAFGIVLAYFGIKGTGNQSDALRAPASLERGAEAAAVLPDADLDLDALLGVM